MVGEFQLGDICYFLIDFSWKIDISRNAKPTYHECEPIAKTIKEKFKSWTGRELHESLSGMVGQTKHIPFKNFCEEYVLSTIKYYQDNIRSKRNAAPKRIEPEVNYQISSGYYDEIRYLRTVEIEKFNPVLKSYGWEFYDREFELIKHLNSKGVELKNKNKPGSLWDQLREDFKHRRKKTKNNGKEDVYIKREVTKNWLSDYYNRKNQIKLKL